MAQVYNRLTLDVKKKNHDIITAVQKDTASRFLDINLVDNGVNINLSGHRVRIYAKKPDGTEVYNDGQITNAVQGRVQIELTSQLLAKEGYIEAQIITYHNNLQILSTLPFKIFVVNSLISDSSVESSNEYGALVVLYQNLYEAMDLMTTMVQRIGTPGTVAQQNNLDTMFKVWEWMITYMKENGTAGLIDKINAIKNNTDLLTNSTYGLNALRNEIRNKRVGDFDGKTFKYYSKTTTLTSSSPRTVMTKLYGPAIIILFKGTVALPGIEVRIDGNLIDKEVFGNYVMGGGILLFIKSSLEITSTGQGIGGSPSYTHQIFYYS